MLRQIFLDHQLKSFIRNDKWRRNILSKILISIFYVFLISVLVILGFNIKTILLEFSHNPIETFNSILLSYIFIDLILRFLFQTVTTTYFTPYLRFKLRHSELVNLMIIRNLWSFFNIVPWCIVVPFVVKCIYKDVGFRAAVLYLSAFLLLVLINNYIAITLKFLTRKRKIFYLIPICIIIVMFQLLKRGTQISTYSSTLVTIIIEQTVLSFIGFIIILISIIYLLRRLFLSGFYFDENFYRAQSRRNQNSSFYTDLLPSFGNVGKYLFLEFKLILRNKRPKQTIMIFPVFPIYLIILLLKKEQDEYLTMLLLAFTFGLLSLLYGQYVFSWESTFFDSIMARKIDFCEYIKAKYYLMISFSLIILILLIPLFIFLYKGFILTLISMFFFSIGTTNFIILFSGIFNDGRITLNESFVFNYQGLSFNQLILPLFVFAIPIGLYYVPSLLNFSKLGNILLIVIGLGFLFFHNWWIKNILLKIFLKRKYHNLEGYRKLMN